jgi:hypothetical protein
MIKRVILSFFVFFTCINIHAQQLLYQDICKCGVTGAGFSTALGFGSGQFQVFIEPGSTIRQAFLFSVKFGKAKDTSIIINSVANLIVNPITSFNAFGSFDAKEIEINAIDFTNQINIANNIYTIDIPVQQSCSGCSINCVYLLIVYENPIFALNSSVNIYLNDIDEASSVVYATEVLNPVLASSPISFATYLDRMGSVPNDGSYLSFFNGSSWINLGLLKGSDQVNSSWDGGAVKGHFYYQNNQMFGLDDDTPDLIVGGSDGLMNASSYLLPNNTLKWSLDWETNSTVGRYNIYNGFFINHTTTCDTFTAQTPKDTTLCQGATLQLQATGGTPNSHSMSGYEWQPATGLSCTDCPNPVFTADSSMFYTVRVWNTDSCSVVRPLKINVRQPKAAPNAVAMASICGVATGTATVSVPAGTIVNSWNEVGGNPQSTGSFTNLISGFHTFFYTDGNGCASADTTVFVPSQNNTQAQFTANPIAGATPLFVNFNNTSANATDYSWSINGANQGSSLPFQVFDTAGIFNITLVAWQYDTLCADTFSIQILAFDSLVVQIPNVFSPNGDGINELYTITANQDVTFEFSIVNRWENLIKNGAGEMKQGIPQVLWKGSDALDGVYFLKIVFEQLDGKKTDYQGFFQLVR